jgi:REP element-mobilizing transposase RayT
MVQEPVLLDKQERAILVKAFREAFDRNGVTPIVISCDAVHVHLLARFPDEGIRTRVAVAKRHSTFRLKKCGRSGKVWARRCGVHPVRDRRHQVATFGYILKHKDKGALVWTFRQEQGSDLSMELL